MTSAGASNGQAARAAQAALAAAFGGPVRLGTGEALRERTTIFRFPVLDGPPGIPASVVVKGPTLRDAQPYNSDADAYPTPAWRLFNDWAGLQFLAEAGGDPPLAPRLYAADRARGLLVMEDLGPGAGLDALLLGGDPAAAEAGLLALAATLGRLHARTSGRQQEYDRLRAALGPGTTNAAEIYAPLTGVFAEMVAAVEIAPQPGAAADVAVVIAAFTNPGPFRRISTATPAPITTSTPLGGCGSWTSRSATSATPCRMGSTGASTFHPAGA